MSVNFQQLAPILAACVTTGGIVFQIGKQSERLETMGFKVIAQEKKYTTNFDAINEMNNKLNLNEDIIRHLSIKVKEFDETPSPMIKEKE